jgi:hypothetical protein
METRKSLHVQWFQRTSCFEPLLSKRKCFTRIKRNTCEHETQQESHIGDGIAALFVQPYSQPYTVCLSSGRPIAVILCETGSYIESPGWHDWKFTHLLHCKLVIERKKVALTTSTLTSFCAQALCEGSHIPSDQIHSVSAQSHFVCCTSCLALNMFPRICGLTGEHLCDAKLSKLLIWHDRTCNPHLLNCEHRVYMDSLHLQQWLSPCAQAILIKIKSRR